MDCIVNCFLTDQMTLTHKNNDPEELFGVAAIAARRQKEWLD